MESNVAIVGRPSAGQEGAVTLESSEAPINSHMGFRTRQYNSIFEAEEDAKALAKEHPGKEYVIFSPVRLVVQNEGEFAPTVKEI